MNMLLTVYFATCVIYTFVLYNGFKSDMKEDNYKTFGEFYKNNEGFVNAALIVCFTPLLNTLVFISTCILQVKKCIRRNIN